MDRPRSFCWSRIVAIASVCIFGHSLAALSSRTIDGVASYDLEEVAEALGMHSEWISLDRSLRLQSQWTRIEGTRGQRYVTLNNVRVYLGNPIRSFQGRLWIAQGDFTDNLQPLLTPQVFSGLPQSVRRVMLDPGHGGKDPGTVNTALRLQEKHLVLDLARRIEALLRAQGYEVLLTRRDDRYVGLAERVAMAQREHVDVFLSLHFNAAATATVEGVETYAFTPEGQPSSARSSVVAADRRSYPANAHDAANALLGFEVHRQLLAVPRAQDRGLKRARFAVLKDLHCPGILVEGGFVSHDREGRDIGSAGYRQQLAEAIANGVVSFDQRLARLP